MQGFFRYVLRLKWCILKWLEGRYFKMDFQIVTILLSRAVLIFLKTRCKSYRNLLHRFSKTVCWWPKSKNFLCLLRLSESACELPKFACASTANCQKALTGKILSHFKSQWFVREPIKVTSGDTLWVPFETVCRLQKSPAIFQNFLQKIGLFFHGRFCGYLNWTCCSYLPPLPSGELDKLFQKLLYQSFWLKSGFADVSVFSEYFIIFVWLLFRIRLLSVHLAQYGFKSGIIPASRAIVGTA